MKLIENFNTLPLLNLYSYFYVHIYYRASAVAASPVLATVGMSVRLSVRHTLALTENDNQARITKSSPKIHRVPQKNESQHSAVKYFDKCFSAKLLPEV